MTLVDTATAAVAAGVTQGAIRRWVSLGKLKPVVTKPHRYRLDDLLAVKDRRRVDNTE